MKEGRKDRISVYFGGILMALLASACCLGPALFLAFGITGLGFLSRFEWLRPYFIILTLVLVGVAYSYAYGKKGSNCGPDGACNPSARRINRILFWVLIGFAVFGLGFPYLSAWLLA